MAGNDRPRPFGGPTLSKGVSMLRTMRIGFVAVCILVLCVATAWAETDKKETTKKTWAVDTSHGTYSDAIPIEVPSFRGITPALALTYDSSGGNGALGVGWSLAGVGVVERVSPGKGAPKYDVTDVFSLDGQELVACAPESVSPSCTSGGTHSTKLESYERIALTGTGPGSLWTVTAKNGTRRVYAPVFTLNGGADVYRWGLAQVVDTTGNVVTYHWGVDEFGCCWEHPKSATYNGTTVTFHYEPRPDIELEAIGNGAMRTGYGRLATIDVMVGSSRVRAYALSYTLSGATSRSLLSSVQQFGTDAELDGSGRVTSGTSLPPITIDYQAGDPEFTQGSQDLVMSNHADAEFFAIDIDGDGRTDVLELYPSLGLTRRRTWISDGDGFAVTSDELGMSSNSKTRFLTMDVDGDGKQDIVELYPSLLHWGLRTWISDGRGFDQGSNDSTATLYDTDSQFLPMDINGDGMSDLLELRRGLIGFRRVSWISNGEVFTQASNETGIGYDEDSRFFAVDVDGDGKSDLLELSPGFGNWTRRVWMSHGAGFSAGAVDFIAHSSDDEFIPMDINGDGKTDLLHIHRIASLNFLNVWLSTGDGFMLASDEPGAPFSSDNWYVAIDVNGDGKSDLVEVDPYGIGVYRRKIWLSVGGRFVAGPSDLELGFDTSTRLMAADVDGDGLSEMIELYPAVLKGRRVWLMNDAYPDLLASVTNSAGGTTSVSYTPSSAWKNTNNPPLVQTVSSVTASDGRGGSATTYYEYAGGRYDRAHRRFLGFRYQRETLPCIEDESACPYSETWFRQDDGAASRPEQIDRRTGDGQLLRSAVYEYTTNGETVPWTSLPTGEWEYAYIGSGEDCPGAECKRTYVGRTFNAFGDVVAVVDHGDYDADGDETTRVTTFVPNTTAYIVNRAAETKTFEGVDTDGVLLDQTRTFYDGAERWDRAPSAGLPTTVARWLSSTDSFVPTHREYDAWGNVAAEIDAAGARTEFTYDTAYHRFEISSTNALRQTTTTTWDIVCGAPTQTTDLNSEPTTMAYDPLCRMSEKIEPGGAFERHRWVNLGDPENQHELIETPPADGTDEPRWTRDYFDGLSRTWRAVVKGPDAATGDIYVDTTYNGRGQEASVTAAYYRVAGEAQPDIHATTFSYDVLGRPTRVAHPDGAYRAKTYGLWSVTDTDELGHEETDYFDAHGRRVAHDEFVDGEVWTTTYVHDLRGHLVESTDPLGNVVTYETDSLGRRTRVDDPDWGTSTYEYDDTHRLTAQTDTKDQRTEFEYDALGRRTSKTSLAGTDEAETVSWTYDEVRDGYANIGHLTTMTDEAGSETYDHDVADNVVETVRTIDGDRYVFEYGFDEGGRKRWTTYPDGDTLGTPSDPLEYDGTGRLTKIPGYVEAARYDAGGKLTRLENANGTVTTRVHSPERRWLTGISTTSGETTIQHLAYTRNDKGMITRVESPFEDESWTYGHDELDRLIAAANTATPELDQEFEYDAIGNITWNSCLGEYAYESSRPHAVTAAGSHVYVYDEAGLMTSGAGRTMTWDGDNRLASIAGRGFSDDADPSNGDDDGGGAGDGGDGAGCGVVRGSGSLAWWTLLLLLAWFRRDRWRARAARRPVGDAPGMAGLVLAFACSGGPGGSGGGPPGSDDPPGADEEATITFTYDADGARIQQVEGSIIRRHLGDGYETEVGGSTIKYVSLAGTVVARKEGETKTWVHTDHLGSIQAETDATGEEVHRKTYGPYGEILATDGTLAFEPRGFTGQRHDASDLVYLHARYYDPTLGRFISPDSIISGSGTIGLNRYAYGANDPVNNTDVDGHSPKKPDSHVGATNRSDSPTRAASPQISVRRADNGGTVLETQHGTHYFSPRLPPPPPTVSVPAQPVQPVQTPRTTDVAPSLPLVPVALTRSSPDAMPPGARPWLSPEERALGFTGEDLVEATTWFARQQALAEATRPCFASPPPPKMSDRHRNVALGIAGFIAGGDDPFGGVKRSFAEQKIRDSVPSAEERWIIENIGALYHRP